VTVQDIKKVARRSGYEGQPLIEEFKRGLSGAIRRKLTKAEEPPTTIGEWQERAVRLDRNQRQSRVEERMLGRNAAHPGGNAQPRGGFGGGSYRGKGEQITWRAGVPHTGGGNMEGNQLGLWRDPNAIDVNRGSEGDRRCYHCGKFGHMAQNCWERNRARVVEMLQELAKKNRGQ